MKVLVLYPTYMQPTGPASNIHAATGPTSNIHAVTGPASNIHVTKSFVSKIHAAPDPTWTISANGQCKQLIIHNSPVQLMSPQQMCSRIDRKFKHIYMIGTSHIRFFADFLMHSCLQKDLSTIDLHHGSLQVQNLHYYDWGLFSTLHEEIHKHLDSWLQLNSSTAIWIQTGSWNFVRIGYVHAMEIGLGLFNQTLAFIKSQIALSSAHVDLQVIATSPMPSGWYWNNFAIGAFNAKMHMICLELGMSTSGFFLQPSIRQLKNRPRYRITV